LEYIYARVSTSEQNHDPQIEQLLKHFPGGQIVTETASGGKTRPVLEQLAEDLQSSDTLVVAALDRLGRRTLDVLKLIEFLDAKGVAVVSLREGVDYRTPVGRLVSQILASVAELERSMIAERTRRGLVAARARGSKLGRPKSIPDEIRELVKRDLTARHYTNKEIAERYGVSPAWVSHLKNGRAN
jgi:DNA invertase Pin-like site-specific DNA recombinase